MTHTIEQENRPMTTEHREDYRYSWRHSLADDRGVIACICGWLSEPEFVADLDEQFREHIRADELRQAVNDDG